MAPNALIPVVVFLAVYVCISFEWLNKAVAALLGMMALLVFGVVDEHAAARYVDFETIMLLLGMMGIVAVLKKSGFFGILTVRIAKWTGGQPLRILVLFCLATAVMSAFLDNVTTVLIMVPIVIELTSGMGLDPKIYVVALAMASNLGGTATLVGDPPNIIIGSMVGLTFNQFLLYLSLPVTLSTIAVLAYFWLSNRRRFRPIDDDLTRLFSVELLIEKVELDFSSVKLDRSFLRKSMACLAVALALFVTQAITHVSPGVVALSVALILFVITGTDIEHVLLEIEWSTLLFFVGLFVLVGALEQTGVIAWLTQSVFLRVGDDPYLMTLTVLWVAAIASGFIDNIPLTVTMVPIVERMLAAHPIPHHILWWALSLGACLGGNLTMIGASANIVAVANLRKQGHRITFLEYARLSAPGTFLSLGIASAVLIAYLWILG